MIAFRVAGFALLLVNAGASACPPDTTAIFACEAGKRKFIELCAPSPIASLTYRFGSLDANGEERRIELEYPKEADDSLSRFYGATYTQNGVYTQSIRFVSGDFGYTVYTRARGMQTIDAGVEVRDRRSRKTSTVSCTERPRFYIFDLKGLVACDPDTPVGKACIK